MGVQGCVRRRSGSDAFVRGSRRSAIIVGWRSRGPSRSAAKSAAFRNAAVVPSGVWLAYAQASLSRVTKHGTDVSVSLRSGRSSGSRRSTLDSSFRGAVVTAPRVRKPSTPRRKPRVAPVDAATAPLTHEQVARRAYELFLQRGGTHGRDRDDWLLAERQLLATHDARPRA
jgi:Protein of unknown function (DUF2934)